MSPGIGKRVIPRWWGWGDPEVPTELPERAKRLLEANGLSLSAARPLPELSEVVLPGREEIPGVVAEAAGDCLLIDHESRLRHAGGHSLSDLAGRRSGGISRAPDGVIVPEDEARVRRVLEACSEASVAVVPWGGGTSVTGALTVDGGSFEAVVAIDLANFTSFDLDPVSLMARFGAGLRGPEAEELLRREGMTLGHFPQSFEFATIGGFAAARSAGQASSGYGRFDDLVSSVRMISPSGELSTPSSRRSSAGPSILEMVLGSEGTLGVITEVTARVRRVPATTLYEGWVVRDFEAGCEAVRELAQSGRLPAVMRVSDQEETGVSLGMSRPDGIVGKGLDAWLALRDRLGGSLVITGFEGSPEEVRARRAAVTEVLSGAGAVGLGRRAGEGWREGRFHGPYLREALLDQGLVIDTFETSAIWSRYTEAYRAIKRRAVERIEELGMKGLVMCHLSHCYPESASLYFTVIATPGPEGPIESWQAIKRAAMEVISDEGLTVSHHHGVGRDHVEWLVKEVGDAGLVALESLKSAFDPSGIMNPGCLVPLRQSDRHRPR